MNGVTGGIIGQVVGRTDIYNCLSKGKINGETVGGIIGMNVSSDRMLEKQIHIEQCQNESELNGNCVGGIAGDIYNTNIAILNSNNKGKIIGNQLGGIVASMGLSSRKNYNCSIMECYNIGIIEGKNESCGGIVGYAHTWGINTIEVSNCYNKGNIINSNGTLGGISGTNDIQNGQIILKNSYNIGKIMGNENCGGVAGENICTDAGTIKIENSYNAGEISGNNNIGGISGSIDIGAQYYVSESGIISITNCYNLGKLNSMSKNVPAIIGGICGNVTNDRGSIRIQNCNNSGKIKFNNANIGGILGNLYEEDATYTIITSCYHNDRNIGGINGQDIIGSAEYSGDLPHILEVIGDMFIEDYENINNGYPILAGI